MDSLSVTVSVQSDKLIDSLLDTLDEAVLTCLPIMQPSNMSDYNYICYFHVFDMNYRFDNELYEIL